MGIKLTKLPELSPENLTESESHLWLLLREREECILQLKDEIARLKGEKGKPKIKPSRLEPEKNAQEQQEETEEDAAQDKQAKKKRPGSEKRQKTANLIIHETKVIQPKEEVPRGSEFKGDQDYTVQELIIGAHNTRYRRFDLENPNGRIPEGKVTRASTSSGALWRNAQKLPSLSIPSLSCYPTKAPGTNARVGYRHLRRTIKPTVGGKQRCLPCREARHSKGRLECVQLHQY
jgi:hypothetical protein